MENINNNNMLGEYVIIRSRNSGVHAGILKKETGNTVILKDSRRIWHWEGAATLSQLSQEGVKVPENCKFPMALPCIKVFGVDEIIPTTPEARKSIEGVPVWAV